MTTQNRTTPPQNFATRATKYAQDVVSGRVLGCKWVKLACQRHLDDLTKLDIRWVYDQKRANAVCAFASQMRHEKGTLQGQRFVLEDWQVFILCSIFGWVDRETGTRKHREAFILVPRGNGKSPLAAIIGLWMAFCDGEKGAEVYCGANSEKQAWEVFRPAKAMVEQEPALGRIGVIAAARSIYHERTRSRFQPVIGKPGDGASVYCGILDEWHEADDAVLYDCFKTGANKRKNSLILIITTAGATTAGPCHNRQQDIQQILDGVIENERVFGIIYGIDDETDWTSQDAVRMANPNFGVSNDAESLLEDHAEAIRNPAKQNTFKTKHLDVWCTAATAWMNMVEWHKCHDPKLSAETVKDLEGVIGSDLASKLDLSATARVHRKDIDGKPHYYAFTRCYLPEARVNLPENQHYRKWVADGHLTATVGSSIDYSVIENEAIADIKQYRIRELPYDARYADQWAQRVSESSGIPRVEVPPNPANLSPALKELEAAVYDGRFHHDGNPVLTWCVSNLLTKETSAGNYTMPAKARDDQKIDAAMALLLAISRAMVLKPKKRASFGMAFI